MEQNVKVYLLLNLVIFSAWIVAGLALPSVLDSWVYAVEIIVGIGIIAVTTYLFLIRKILR